MTTATQTLTEFLLAQIEADEAAATSRDLTAPIHYVGCYYYSHTLEANVFCDCDESGVATARVLAQCKAYRAIVAFHGSEILGICQEYDGDQYPCRTLRALASIYADRDGFDPRWTP